ncbi:MAG: Bro-N domain-containing protein [Lachnospiraceae bacterium]|nr:Bro-N domain-containing protein [Lachnospiraceae bacterium]
MGGLSIFGMKSLEGKDSEHGKERWSAGKDAAKALGYGEGKPLNNAVTNHVDEEDTGAIE